MVWKIGRKEAQKSQKGDGVLNRSSALIGANLEPRKNGRRTALAELHEDGLAQEVSVEKNPVTDLVITARSPEGLCVICPQY